MKQFFERLRREAEFADTTDGELLSRVHEQRDEAAFAELLRRYGPLVWGVCRRGLRQTTDSEDAFQAVFLILFRKAGTLGPTVPLAPWLHRTAVWTVLNSRRRQRTARATSLAVDVAARATPDFEVDDLLASLPEKYRSPIVLCHLHGLSRSEAARALGIAEGTLSTRLHRGLKRLKARHSAILMAAIPTVAVPTQLTALTTQAVLTPSSALLISPAVLILTQGVLRMFWIKQAAAVVMFSTAVGVGIVATTMTPSPSNQAQAQTPEVVKEVQSLLDGSRKKLAIIDQATRKIEDHLNKKTGIEFWYVADTPSGLPFVYRELVEGEERLSMSTYESSQLSLFTKRMLADPTAPKEISIIWANSDAGQEPASKALEEIRGLVKAILGAGITKVKYTGFLPVSVDYVTTTTQSKRINADGTIVEEKPQETTTIAKEVSKHIREQEIDLTKVFPAKYLSVLPTPKPIEHRLRSVTTK